MWCRCVGARNGMECNEQANEDAVLMDGNHLEIIGSNTRIDIRPLGLKHAIKRTEWYWNLSTRSYTAR